MGHWIENTHAGTEGAVAGLPWDFQYALSRGDPTIINSYNAVQARIDTIKLGNTSPATTHPRIFISDAASKTARVARIADCPNLATRWQSTLDDLDAGWGTEVASTTTYPNGNPGQEPTMQARALLCALIYQLGQSNLSGPNYNSHTDSEYGDEAARLLNDTVDNQTFAFGNQMYTWPLVYDWVHDKLTAGERTSAETWMFDRADAAVPAHQNNPGGSEILGLIASDNATHQARADTDFYDGVPLGDPKNYFDREGGLQVGGRNIHHLQMLNPLGPGNEGWWYMHNRQPTKLLLMAWADQFSEDYAELPCIGNQIRTLLNGYHHSWVTGSYSYAEAATFGGSGVGWQPYKFGTGTGMEDAMLWSSFASETVDPDVAGFAKNEHEKYDDVGAYLLPSLAVLYPFFRPTDAAIPLKNWSDIVATNYWTINAFMYREGTDDMDQLFLRAFGPYHPLRGSGTIGDFCVWHNNAEIVPKRWVDHDYDGGNRTNTPSLYNATLWDDYEFIPRGAVDRSRNRSSLQLTLFSLDDDANLATSYFKGFTHYGHRSDLIYFRTEHAGVWQGFNGLTEVLETDTLGSDWVRRFWFFVTHKVIVVHDLITPDDGTTDAVMNWQHTEEQVISGDVIKDTNTTDLGTVAANPWGVGHARKFITALEPSTYTLTKFGGHYEDGVGFSYPTQQTPGTDRYGNPRGVTQQVNEVDGPTDNWNRTRGMFRTEVTRTAVGGVFEYWFAIELTDDTQPSATPVSLNVDQDVVTFGSSPLVLEETT